jgi:hypothetical protein
MMQIFSEFAADLANRRSLRRDVDGGHVTYRIRLYGKTPITIMTNEVNPESASRVCSEPWPTLGGDGEFMRKALNFNRNALHHLPCGVILDPEERRYFRLIWTVPSVSRSAPEWTAQLILFGKLTEKAWSTLSSQQVKPSESDQYGQGSHVIFMP